jgi:hypothetical protein
MLNFAKPKTIMLASTTSVELDYRRGQMNAIGKGIQDWKEYTWRIYLKLDMPSFKFPVIQ